MRWVSIFCVALCFLQVIGFSQKPNADTAKISELIVLAENIILKDPDTAMVIFDNVLRLTEVNLKQKLSPALRNYFLYKQSIALNDIGYIYYGRGDYKTSVGYFERGLLIDEQFGDELSIASSINNISNIYFSLGDIKKAIQLMNRSLLLYTKNKSDKGMSDAYNALGYYYDYLGDYNKAVDYYHASLKISEQSNSKKEISVALNNLGSYYKSIGEIEKSLEYYAKSYKLKQELKDVKGMAFSLNNIGSLYRDKGELEKGLTYIKEGLLLREKIGDKKGMALAYNNIGSVLKQMNRNDSALFYFKKGLVLRHEIGDKDGEVSSLYSIGTVLMSMNDVRAAKPYADRSYHLAKELGFPSGLSAAANLMKDVYSKLGLFEKAFLFQSEYFLMRDSLNNLEKKKSGLKAQFKYSYEKQAAADSVEHAKQTQLKNLELANQKAELEVKRNQQYALFGGLALVLVFAAMMYNRFKVTNRQKKIIEIKEQETQKQNEIISYQKHIVEEKQKEILDSINYAKRIQYTLLAHDEFLRSNLNSHFVYFNPKDIVSGDFYWAAKKGNKFYLAVCDSTGHGVPGAFMSLLNIGFLTEAINEKGIERPNDVLNFVRQRLIDNISKEGQQDGFDGILMCMEMGKAGTQPVFTYAAANNAPVIVKRTGAEHILLELEADRMPVGIGERKEDFKLFTMDVGKGDVIYLYTDGFADQFGGPKGKKFKYKTLNQLILDNSGNRMEVQKQKLLEAFNNWKGDLEQVDDVCVVGVLV